MLVFAHLSNPCEISMSPSVSGVRAAPADGSRSDLPICASKLPSLPSGQPSPLLPPPFRPLLCTCLQETPLLSQVNIFLCRYQTITFIALCRRQSQGGTRSHPCNYSPPVRQLCTCLNANSFCSASHTKVKGSRLIIFALHSG